MLGENMMQMRKRKGLSQQALADEIHVVRQTISKWEKNLSVPDAETLTRLADALDTTVQELLGVPAEKSAEPADVAEALAQINEQLAVQNRRRGRIWRVVAWVLALLVAFHVLLLALGWVFSVDVSMEPTEVVTVEESAETNPEDLVD